MDEDRPGNEIACGACGQKRATKTANLPSGWKRHGQPEVILCDECLDGRFDLRAVTIPVATVIDGGTWDEFMAILKAGWVAATDVSNWAVTELARLDAPALYGEVVLKPRPKPYLYPGAIAVANPAESKGRKKNGVDKVAKNISPASVNCVVRSIEHKYAATRKKLMKHQEVSFPRFKYPQPLPLHKDNWDCCEGPGGRACIKVTVGESRWTLALATAGNKRQLAAWRTILGGLAIKGEMALIRQEVTMSDRRQHGLEREPGGGRQKTIRVMAKMVARFPKKDAGELDGTLYCWTSEDHFLNYRIGITGFVHRLDAQHVQRWVAEHRRKRQGMSNDLKYEKQWPKKTRQQSNERMEVWSKKQRDRIDTFAHEASATIAKFAERQKVATVVYDDSVKAYVQSFPWAALKGKLQYKLHARSVAFSEGDIPDCGNLEVNHGDNAVA